MIVFFFDGEAAVYDQKVIRHLIDGGFFKIIFVERFDRLGQSGDGRG